MASLVQIQEMIASGRLEQARAALSRIVAREPRNPEALGTMVAVLAKLGDRVQAVYYAERCAKLLPRDGRAQMNLGQALLDAGRYEEAEARMAAALGVIDPDEHAYAILAHSAAGGGRHAAAVEWAERGLGLFAESEELLVVMAMSSLACGEAARAVECCRRARRLDPANPGLCSNLLSILNYADLEVQRAAPETHALYGRLVAERFGPPRREWLVTREPDRPLRVGILSPDFRTHAVSYFAEPVLRHHDRSQWTLVAYSTANPEDARTEVLRGLVGEWRRIGGWRFVDAAEQIRQDRIDVLIDLAGHTNGHALPAMHLKPAPVQMTWVGYPHSTGVPSVDYRIVDSITDPPPATGERWPCVERPLYLDPCFVVWEPPEGIPDPSARPPCEQNGYITFGAFAALQKFSEATVRMWARVLKAVPASRLLYKTTSLKTEAVRERVMRRLTGAGVDASRIMLEPPGAGAREMMPNYARMDISLDTFPYHGTTTTCECLWMGVPMVTLEGPVGVPASRVSGSIIRAVAGDAAGRMVAGDEDGYVSLAAELAGDRSVLARWRSMGAEGLRARMAASAVRDGPGRCRQLEGAVRAAWREWCATDSR